MTAEDKPVPGLREAVGEERYIELRNGFMLGCINLVKRGELIPASIFRAIAAEFDLLQANPSGQTEVSSQDIE